MNTFLLVFNALPTIIQSVQAVEAAIPVSQTGQHKLNLVLGAAGTAWELGQVAQQLPKNDTVQAVAAITNLTVAALNATGVFKHAATADTASAK